MMLAQPAVDLALQHTTSHLCRIPLAMDNEHHAYAPGPASLQEPAERLARLIDRHAMEIENRPDGKLSAPQTIQQAVL